MIKVKNVHKRFGSQVVLDGVDLEVPLGETIAIVGPSGTGKSVLLKIIIGLLEPEEGEVLIGEKSITALRSTYARNKLRSQMGVLFQAAALFDSMTLLDNVAFPLRYRKDFREKEIIAKSLKCLEQVGLRGSESALPGEVSMGMRKRVGIARALVTEPKVILFDEPNTGLDPETGQEIYDLIAETQQEREFAGIVISHEIPEVFQICSRVAMLFNGKIQEQGAINTFLLSKNPAVTQFVRGDIEGPIQMM